MRILGFDTATSATAVAICDLDGDSVAAEARDDPLPGERPAHTTRLLPLIAQVLEHSNSAWEDVERIAVGTGPGTFTGLRIGIATARALARARALPLTGVSTLHSLASNASLRAGVEGAEIVLAVIDARRGELFAAAWSVAELGDQTPRAHRSLIEAAPRRPDVLAAIVQRHGSRTMAVGDGAVKSRDVLERSGVLVPADDSEFHKVSAVSHCRIARLLPGGPPDQISPEYLRRPDAEIARRAVHHR